MAPHLLHGPTLATLSGGLKPIGALALAAGALLFWLAGDDEARLATGRRLPASPVPGRRNQSSDRPLRAGGRIASAPIDSLSADGGSARQARERIVLAPRQPFEPPTRPEMWSPRLFEVIEWRRFEALTEALFRQSGFETRSQSHGPDSGADVWLHSARADGRVVGVVQCKHEIDLCVGVDRLRQLLGVMDAKGVARGHFVAPGGFTADAVAFAEANGIHLIDGQRLLGLVARRPPEAQRQLLDVALEGEFWRPTCPSCGIKLVERRGLDSQGFWGCANHPRCRCTMPRRRS
ncbi:restriction endonuclease [Derxia gummosa]|uniref:Restriction endonuclease n=1 Tax=Derxia gummosa DSM 723 TaxID=1121388 RepID=A0A8B6X970_9BURK|nr:restriction endonuclease [Derxia gummosa]